MQTRSLGIKYYWMEGEMAYKLTLKLGSYHYVGIDVHILGMVLL